MAITISGSGITSANIADGTIVSGDIADGTIVNADVADVAASKLTGALPAISGAALTNLPGGGKVLGTEAYYNLGETDYNAVNSGTWLDITGFNITYTPQSSTSSLYLRVEGGLLRHGTGDWQGVYLGVATSGGSILGSSRAVGPGNTQYTGVNIVASAEYTSHTAGTAITFKGMVTNWGQYGSSGTLENRALFLTEVEAN